jgi:hypothetical protein
MRYICNCGREGHISWNKFSQGRRCGICRGHRKKYTIEEVKKIFEDRGCSLLSENYVNSKDYILKYICSCGEYSEISFYNFMHSNKYNCKKCATRHCKAASELRKLSQSEVEEEFEKNGCKLLDKYENYNAKINYICKCGRKSVTTFHQFKSGDRCGRCGEKRSVKFTFEEVLEIFKDEGCEFLDDNYVNVKTSHKFKCSCGNIESIKLLYFRKGSRCSYCKKKNRSGENHFAWRRDREGLKLDIAFRKRVYNMLYRCYKKLGTEKQYHSHEILGYTPIQLKDHITSHPNWQSVKDGDWQIDHIFPISAFLENGVTDLGIINCLDNLQPMLMKDNYSKNDKYNINDFKEWLSKLNINYA